MRRHKWQSVTGQFYTDIMSKDAIASWAFLSRLVSDGQWVSSLRARPDARIVNHLLGEPGSGHALITVAERRGRVVIKVTDEGRRAVRLYHAQTCEHPPAKRLQSDKRATRRWGSAPVEECACGAWRTIINGERSAWHEDITIEEYNRDDD